MIIRDRLRARLRRSIGMEGYKQHWQLGTTYGKHSRAKAFLYPNRNKCWGLTGQGMFHSSIEMIMISQEMANLGAISRASSDDTPPSCTSIYPGR